MTEKWSSGSGCGLMLRQRNWLHDSRPTLPFSCALVMTCGANLGLPLNNHARLYSVAMLLTLPPSHRPSKGGPRPVEYCASTSITHNGPARGRGRHRWTACWPSCLQAHLCPPSRSPLLQQTNTPPGAGWSVTGRLEAGPALCLPAICSGHRLVGGPTGD